MKIVQVCPRYAPHTGGVETHVQEISERLVKRGHEVTVVTADAGRDVEPRESRNGVQIRRCRSLSPGGAFHIGPGVYRVVTRLDADVVHAHNYHSLPMLFATFAVGEARLVVTPHYHGGSASSWHDRLLRAYRPAGGWALRRADALIAVSEWERMQLEADFGVEATVIPNGVDIERFANAEPEERERPYLLTVGRLEEYKGVQHVIRALSEINAYELVVAGKGPYDEELRRIAREEGVSDRVTFLGFVNSSRLPSLYTGADVYITLSEFESYGMTVAEALAARTPCVILQTGGLSDWCAENGVHCVAETNLETVVERVDGAVGDAVDSNPPTWNEVTTRVTSVYRSASK